MTDNQGRETHRWRSYDSAAPTYDRTAAPLLTLPARDLVAMLGLSSGELVLDVGAGAGEVPRSMAERYSTRRSRLGDDNQG